MGHLGQRPCTIFTVLKIYYEISLQKVGKPQVGTVANSCRTVVNSIQSGLDDYVNLDDYVPVVRPVEKLQKERVF